MRENLGILLNWCNSYENAFCVEWISLKCLKNKKIFSLNMLLNVWKWKEREKMWVWWVVLQKCFKTILETQMSKMWNKKKIKIDKFLIVCIKVKREWKWILVFKWFF